MSAPTKWSVLGRTLQQLLERAMESADLWLPALAFISIASSAFFGLLALFTEYKTKDGRITLPGKLAATGIVLAGAVSLGTNHFETLKRNEERKVEEAAAKQRAAEVQAQLKALRKANAGVADIQDETLILGDDLSEALDTTRKLQREHAANAAKTLRDIWRSTNAVDTTNLRLVLQRGMCANRVAEFIKAGGTQVAIFVAPTQPAVSISENGVLSERKGWSDPPPGGAVFVTPAALDETAEGWQFSRFVRERMDKRFRTLDGWVGAHMVVMFQAFAVELKDVSLLTNGGSPIGDGPQADPHLCHFQAHLVVNGSPTPPLTMVADYTPGFGGPGALTWVGTRQIGFPGLDLDGVIQAPVRNVERKRARQVTEPAASAVPVER